jgi:preflagellin peptidase FlaK
MVSFPFLLAFVIYLVGKNDSFKRHPEFIVTLFDVENLKNLIHSTLNRTIFIKDLKEGNIVNDYDFDDEYIIELINEVDGNLEVFRNEDGSESKYYFKSSSAGGITKEEMTLIKVMSAQGYIGDSISIKISYPFTPAIFAGLLIAVFYGDIIMLFTKNMALVI